MSAGFTEGPWVVHDTIDGPLANTDVRDRRNLMVARCAPMMGRPHVKETEVNARLIAAAPELYADGERLASEIHGLLYAYEDGLRDLIGHTNFNIYAERLKAFQRALAKASAGEASGQDPQGLDAQHEHATPKGGRP